ncbi:TolC family protein [Enterobacter quasihormaechei]|uniref:TolC family protein n=1 Tax=Enterobacter quasihormaechei TaxID=2529382 RepID=UPI002F3E71C1
MSFTQKTLLYLSVSMGNILMATDAICASEIFSVTFIGEEKKSVTTVKPTPRQERVNDNNIVFSNPVKMLPSAKKTAQGASTEVSKKSVSASKEKYDLHSAMWMAVSWHPEIKRAKSETERLKSMVDEARASYYPNVEVGLNSGLEKDDYSDDNNKTNQVNVSIEQMIYDFGSTADRVELSEFNVINADYEVEKKVNDILYQTIGAYLQIVRYYQLSNAAKDRIDGFTKIKEITKKRVALGASAESDYSQASLRVTESLSSYNDYMSQYKKWSATLDYLLNKPVSSRIIMEIPAEVENVYNDVLRDNPTHIDSPAIRIARAKIDIAKKEIDVQKNGHYPKITLTPYYEYDLTAQTTSNNVTRNRDRYGAFINVKVPLYQGGSVSSKVQQAQEALSTAQYNLDAEENNAKQRLMEFSSQMKNTKVSLENKLERERSAIRTRDLYMAQYLELGTRSFSDLTSAESEIHQTRTDIINGNYTVSNLSLESLYYAGKLINLLKTQG